MNFSNTLSICCLIWSLFSCVPKPKNQNTHTPDLPTNHTGDTTIQKLLNIAFITGQFEPDTHPDFVPIDSLYTPKKDIYLHKSSYEAFKKMFQAAKHDGIKLEILSATRNFNYQKRIWERKWTGKTKIENGTDASQAYPNPVHRALAILRYSSMPGTSRHHWGTDIDLNSFDNHWFEQGKGDTLYRWLTHHASKFGFCQVYTPKDSTRPNGYEEEKWHWSYIPIAKELTRYAEKHLKNQDISKFSGAEVAKQIKVVEQYVLGINPQCN